MRLSETDYQTEKHVGESSVVNGGISAKCELAVKFKKVVGLGRLNG